MIAKVGYLKKKIQKHRYSICCWEINHTLTHGLIEYPLYCILFFKCCLNVLNWDYTVHTIAIAQLMFQNYDTLALLINILDTHKEGVASFIWMTWNSDILKLKWYYYLYIFRTPVCQPMGRMCCVGGWQSQTSSLRFRLDPLFSTQPETTSARYQCSKDTIHVTTYLFYEQYSLHLLFFPCFFPSWGTLWNSCSATCRASTLVCMLWTPKRCTTSISTCCTCCASTVSRCVYVYEQSQQLTETRVNVKASYMCVCVSLQVTDAYSEYDAGRVIRVLQAFIARDLSSFYFSIIKDR